jgi:hypothetical protein
MKLTQISHLFNELGIPMSPNVFSHSPSLIASVMNKIYPGTAVAHITSKYYLAADMSRDGEIDLSYVRTAEMLADCLTKPLPKPTCLKQCAVMRMIGIRLVNGLRMGLGTLVNRRGNGIRMRNGRGIGNATGKYIDSALLFKQIHYV